jgi:hypothetical protein
MIARISELIVCPIAFMVPTEWPARGERAWSILSLDQSDLRSPIVTAVISAELSIARTIVQAHRGQILEENRPEGGSISWISYPLSSP